MKLVKLPSMLMGMLFLVIMKATTGCSAIDHPSVVTSSSVQLNIPSTIEHILPALTSITTGSNQVILVSNTDPQSFFVKVYVLEKKKENWHLVFEPFDAVIGKNGFAAPGEKREGDKMTPTGIYALNRTFGYEQALITRMPYKQVTNKDIWVDDINSAEYNKLVYETDTIAASYEKMKRDDDLYKYGIVVEYNTNPVIKGFGSAIFFHIWRGPDKPTTGCIAMSENNIRMLIGWLDPSGKPMVAMGTQETLRDSEHINVPRSRLNSESDFIAPIE